MLRWNLVSPNQRVGSQSFGSTIKAVSHRLTRSFARRTFASWLTTTRLHSIDRKRRGNRYGQSDRFCATGPLAGARHHWLPPRGPRIRNRLVTRFRSGRFGPPTHDALGVQVGIARMAHRSANPRSEVRSRNLGHQQHLRYLNQRLGAPSSSDRAPARLAQRMLIHLPCRYVWFPMPRRSSTAPFAPTRLGAGPY